MLDIIPLIISCLSGIVSILAIVNFVHSRKQESKERQRQLEEDAVWKASVNQQLSALTQRVDSHNRYAEMFREYGEDIAFIRGCWKRNKKQYNTTLDEPRRALFFICLFSTTVVV